MMTNNETCLLTDEEKLLLQREALKITITFLNEAIGEFLDAIGLPKDGLSIGIDEKDAHQFYELWDKLITRAIQTNNAKVLEMIEDSSDE